MPSVQGFRQRVLYYQARKMAKRVARIYGGEPVVNVYKIDDDFMKKVGLNIKEQSK